MERIGLIYLAAVSLIGLSVMGIDKWKARHQRWRIPEKVLFLIALLGGSPGIWAGMYLFRHKTRHPQFVIGIPMILAVQAAAVFAVKYTS